MLLWEHGPRVAQRITICKATVPEVARSGRRFLSVEPLALSVQLRQQT